MKVVILEQEHSTIASLCDGLLENNIGIKHFATYREDEFNEAIGDSDILISDETMPDREIAVSKAKQLGIPSLLLVLFTTCDEYAELFDAEISKVSSSNEIIEKMHELIHQHEK